MGGLAQNAVDPEADPHLVLVGLEVDVGGALPHRLAEDAVDELDHRRVLGADLACRLTSASSSSASSSPSSTASLTALCRVLRRPISASMSSSAATATRQSSAGGDLDVVDREHVGRVRHRDQQGLLVDEADRQRAVAARRVDRDQVGGRHVDLVGGEVDVVEAVALGDRS